MGLTQFIARIRAMEAFKKAPGEVIKNKAGEPQVFYHGSSSKYFPANEMKGDELGRNFFSKDKDTADFYRDVDYNAPGVGHLKEVLLKSAKHGKGKDYDMFAAPKTPETTKYWDDVKNKGFDVFTEPRGAETVAFKPEQIHEVIRQLRIPR